MPDLSPTRATAPRPSVSGPPGQERPDDKTTPRPTPMASENRPPQASDDGQRPRQAGTLSLEAAVLGHELTGGDRFGRAFARGVSATTQALQEAAATRPGQIASAAITAMTGLVWQSRVADLVGQMMGMKPNAAAPYLDAFKAPIMVTAVGAGLVMGLTKAFTGPGTYYGRLANLDDIKGNISSQHQENLVQMLDRIREAVKTEKGEDAVKSLGPQLLEAVPYLYALQFDDNRVPALASLIRTRSAGGKNDVGSVLNEALGLDTPRDAAKFWCKLHDDVVKPKADQ